jgi:hypothetical protein
MLDFKFLFREAGTDLPNPFPSDEFQKPLISRVEGVCERQRKGHGKEAKCYWLRGGFLGR